MSIQPQLIYDNHSIYVFTLFYLKDLREINLINSAWFGMKILNVLIPETKVQKQIKTFSFWKVSKPPRILPFSGNCIYIKFMVSVNLLELFFFV